MNSTGSENKNKIKRRKFFYYIGAAALGAVVFTKFPFNLLKRSSQSTARISSIKVTENPYAVKRTARVSAPSEKGPVNG